MMTEISIFPEPVKLEKRSGTFIISKKTMVLVEKSVSQIGEYLITLLQPTLRCAISSSTFENFDGFTKENSIYLRLFKLSNALGKEGYSLNVTEHNITLIANTAVGIFYGIQTIRQLCPPTIEKPTERSDQILEIPCCEIEDYPRFSWRGYMLDEGRSFFGKEIVKKLLDLMALLKLNVFHWHLTEDQGWRIEIKKYPRFTTTGAWRSKPITPRGPYRKPALHPLGGFYTQDEIREIVTYATDRFIQIVPEIEMPGHSQAAIASYPELGCSGSQIEVATSWGVKHDVYCAGKDSTYRILQDILDEVLELFPSRVIHTGGDEVPKNHWNGCSICQAKLQNEHLDSMEALQRYFTNRMSKYLASKDRRLMGWDEILDSGLDPHAIFQYWAGKQEKALVAIRKGHEMVNSWHNNTYLDYSYKSIPLAKAYAFDPIPPGLDQKFYSQILGLEGPMWGEVIPDLHRLEWLTFPRLIAIAETGWTPITKKDYTRFYQHLPRILERLKKLDVNFAPLHIAEPTWFKRLFSFTRFY